MPDGTWVWCMLAADGNVRTLGGARCGAPLPRGGFVIEGCFFFSRSTKAGTCLGFEVGGARVVGETKFK
jgi:hypothetical protein